MHVFCSSSYWCDHINCSVLNNLFSCFCLSWRCGLELQALEAVKCLNTASGTVVGQLEPGWEVVMEKKDFKVWKRPIPNSHLYEYRGRPSHSLTCVNKCLSGSWSFSELIQCFVVSNFEYMSIHWYFVLPAVLGSYNDVTPRQFFNVQVQFFSLYASLSVSSCLSGFCMFIASFSSDLWTTGKMYITVFCSDRCRLFYIIINWSCTTNIFAQRAQHKSNCKLDLCAILSPYPWLVLSPFPQLDTEYRKKWDSLVIKLEVVDRDACTGSEVVHWATHFPVSFRCWLI